MSCFIVNDETINEIVTFLDRACNVGTEIKWVARPMEKYTQPDNNVRGKVLNALAQSMMDMNVASVDARYPNGQNQRPGPIANGNPGDAPFVYSRKMAESRYQTYKSLESYLYQCSEGDIENWDLYKCLNEVKNRLADYLVKSTREYELAKWR